MSAELKLLLVTAATIGFLHTVLGPDHYLPFIVMARARRWSTLKTALLTVACGLGHVLSSVAIGLIGIALGVVVGRLQFIEGVRGQIAAWALTAFGLVYGVWGLRHAMRNRPHEHAHLHAAPTEQSAARHSHDHAHRHDHSHVHDVPATQNITPWILFTVFVLGPCEPLIPILMYPAAEASVLGLVMVTVVFGIVTITTMLAMVLTVSAGVNLIPLRSLERYSHALAGAALFVSGAAVLFLGL